MSDEEKNMSHESFGFIRASRVQGRTSLFDSAIDYQHFVSITVGEAHQTRTLYRTWNFADRELITVDLSEHQFAQFITSMNTGFGSPCTIRRFNGVGREKPPVDLNTRESFEPEIRAETEKVAALLTDGIAKLSDLAAKGTANKSELAAALSAIKSVQSQLVLTLPFVLAQFAKHMDELTNRAKSDLSAHAVMLGLDTAKLKIGRDSQTSDGNGSEDVSP